MNLSFEAHEVKKYIKTTNINKYFESTKETKSATLFEITLTHIDTGLFVTSDGYSEIDVMSKCLKKLDELVATQLFMDCMPFDHITSETEVVNTTVK